MLWHRFPINPFHMKAFTIQKYDKKGALMLTDIPVPVLKEDEVLVEIHAAGLNLLDAKIKVW
ncbi:hypothetical protein D3C87_1588020 [compost metagenome]